MGLGRTHRSLRQESIDRTCTSGRDSKASAFLVTVMLVRGMPHLVGPATLAPMWLGHRLVLSKRSHRALLAREQCG